MKILEVHYTTSWAGAERFVVDLSDELSSLADVTLLTTNDDKIKDNSYYLKDLKEDVSYINLHCQSGLRLNTLWKLYKTIKKERPDIVHAHTDAICLFLPALLFRKPKYFHTLHNLAEVCLRTRWMKPIYKFFYSNCLIHPITISGKCDLSYKKLYNLNNSIEIDNGRIPPKVTAKLSKVKEEIDSKKRHDDDAVFIHVARCSKQKNQQLLIDCFKSFLDKGNHAILIMIGAEYDKPENKNILDSCGKGIYWLGLKDNVCDYLKCADFFILSSLWEGLPISLLEALSFGVIPVCTPAGGIPDVIKDETIGFVSTSFCFEDFYNTIEQAFKHKSVTDKKHIIDYFNKNFSMSVCARKYYQTFIKLIINHE